MKSHIKDISNELRVKPGLIINALYRGNRGDAYTIKEIPKKNGEPRIIHAVNGSLRVLQKIAYNWLSYNYHPKSSAKGFVLGGGIIENAKIHRNKKLVLCYDLKNFFPAITFARVQGMFMSYPFEFSKQKATLFAQICCLPDDNGSIPQGGITSPFVSNMICRRLDTRLNKLAISKRMKYSRYADDLSFSTNDNVNYENFTKIVKDIIEDEHFKLNDKKSRLLKKCDRQSVTGIVVNEGLNVNRKYIRSIRATLYNCSQYGVLSQIAKKTKYKDPWSSCPPIGRNESGKYYLYKNGNPIEIKDAKYKFMQHLLGRIQFIGHVAKANKSLNQNHYKQRNRIYKNLLEMWERVRSNEKITGRIKAQAQKALHQEQDIALLEAINNYPLNKLNEFKLEQEIIDPRYFTFSFSIGNINNYRNELINLAKYPKADKNKVMEYLYQLKDSDNHVLGKLVHDKIVSIKEFNEFRLQFEKDKFYLPMSFRKSLDNFINKDIRNFIKDEDINFNTFSDELFVANTIHKFKRNTRFSNVVGDVRPDETDLVNLIEMEFKRAKNPKKLGLNISELGPLKFYTFIPSVKYALSLIITSMFDNSLGSIINCKIDPETYSLEISDNNIESMTFLPKRDFISGKLMSVIFNLNALCEYSIIANFGETGWKNINMMRDDVKDIDEYTGFTHRLVFKK